MKRRIPSSLLVVTVLALAATRSSAGRGATQPDLALENGAATLRVSLNGGVLTDFRLAGDTVNPLQGMGHFLCLDRWGPPSEAEAMNGMPFHGEASKAAWRVSLPPTRESGGVEALMGAELPLAGLAIRRALWMPGSSALVVVRETVTNRNRLGRIYNMVQHPTIGGPFLDEDTVVDAGAGRGFMQSSPLPDPERPEVRWPYALLQNERVDLRRLADDPNPNVVSYEVRGALGWTTAINPERRLLIGYVWPKDDFPWFNAWRHVENGKPALRGLEFGTTGLHQPFPVLVKKGRIFDLPLYAHLDAGESVIRSYAMFLARTPEGFTGVGAVTYERGKLRVRERKRSGRSLTVEAPSVLQRWQSD